MESTSGPTGITKPTRKGQLDIVLADLHRGKTVTEINEKLLEIMEAIEDVGGVGELTITLKCKRTQRGEVEINSDIKSKVPKAKRPPSLFFFDRDKQTIARDDPAQKLLLEEATILREETRP